MGPLRGRRARPARCLGSAAGLRQRECRPGRLAAGNAGTSRAIAGLAQVGEPGQQPGPAARAPALDRALRDADYLGRIGDRVVEHVDQDQRDLLIVRQLAERGHHLERQSRCRRPDQHWRRPMRSRRAAARHRWRPRPGRAPAHPVQAGVHDDPVQPGRDGGLAAEARRAPEGRDHRVLQRIRRVLGVVQRPDGNRPQPVPVPGEQLAEGIGVAVDMQPQQLGVAELGCGEGNGRSAPGRRAGWSLAWRVLGPAGPCAARLLRFRRLSRSAGATTARAGRLRTADLVLPASYLAQAWPGHAIHLS